MAVLPALAQTAQTAPAVPDDGDLGAAAERAVALGERTWSLLPLLALAAGVLAGFWLLGVFLGGRRGLWRRIAPNELIADLFRTLVPVIFLLIGIVFALTILDAMAILSAVLGAAGVAGLAIGFAVRDTIENFVASIMLSLRQPFRPNDFVDIDGRKGHVVRLTSRATILLDPDGNHTRIPNAQVFKAVIVNYTRRPERRLTFTLGIDGADDPGAAIRLGLERLHALDFVIAEPAPAAWIEEVGDSNIVITFAPFIDQTKTDFLKARSSAIADVKTALETGGFTLPEPIYRLRIDQAPPGLLGAADVKTERPDPDPQPRPAASVTPLETAKDRTFEKQVAEDRAQSEEDDLLSPKAPTEFGDPGT